MSTLPGQLHPLFEDLVDERRRSRRLRGHLSHVSWYGSISDDLWKIRIRKRRKKNLRGLPKRLRKQSFAALEEAVPTEADEPAALTAPAKTKTARRRRAQAQRAYDEKLILAYRNKAIWAFLLMTGFRIGEALRIRLDDVDMEEGIVRLEERAEDARRVRTKLKGGPGKVYVSARHPYWSYIEDWLTFGRPIAAARLELRGGVDHEMLFCNRDGGPLTRAAVRHLFHTLADRLGVDREAVQFSPHALRHTMATAMLNGGVPKEIVQEMLRHASMSSTEEYSKMEEKRVRDAMDLFAASLGSA